MTDPGKWRIIGARADAWLTALADNGLAVVDRDTAIDWRVSPGTVISRTDRAVPFRSGALALVVARSKIEDIDDAGVTLGVSTPAVCVTWIPSCGCDACDSGAQYELDQLDAHIISIVSGRFRRLTHRDQAVTVLDDGWVECADLLPGHVAAVLADPEGWDEISGSSWLDEERSPADS